MKKYLTTTLILSLLFCGVASLALSTDTVGTASAAPEGALVVYFSRGGNTILPKDTDAISSPSLRLVDGDFTCDAQSIAAWIAEETHSDLYAIRTARKYPIDYDEVLSVGRQERIRNARPKLVSEPLDLSPYTAVYLVYPNWWGDLPMPVYSFFDAHDLSGKTILAVVTSGGNAFSDTLNTLRRLEPRARVLKGISISKHRMSEAREQVVEWLRGL